MMKIEESCEENVDVSLDERKPILSSEDGSEFNKDKASWIKLLMVNYILIF